MYYSILRTLADKYRKSVKQVRTNFDINGHFGVKYSTNTGEKVIMYYNGGFRRKDNPDNITKDIDIKIEYNYPFGKFSPAYRLYRKTCEMCGATNVAVTMYHVRKITEIIKPDTPWHILMLENNRKTLSAFEHCYSIIQAS